MVPTTGPTLTPVVRRARPVCDHDAMPARTADPALLARLERYYDTVPRSGASAEPAGPFTLFVPRGGFPLYARPRLGLAEPIGPDDVATVLARQRSLGIPEAIEWVVETTPSLAGAARSLDLEVLELPLLVLDQPANVETPPGITVRRVPADEPDLSRILAVAAIAFGARGTAIGEAGAAERDRQAAAGSDHDALRRRLADGLTVLYVAEDATGPLASGAHQPVADVTEVVGVATLPAARRRGLGAAVTAALVADASTAGLDTIFLSAASDDVARIYERLGFRRMATAGLANRGDPFGASIPAETTAAGADGSVAPSPDA